MYAGSFPHIVAIGKAIQEFNDIYVCMNTFWLSFRDYKSKAYLEEWLEIIRKFAGCSRIKLQSPARRTIDNVRRIMGIDMELAAHPSTTYYDTAADTNSRKPSPEPVHPLTVLFPAGISQDKGFKTTTEIVKSLSYSHNQRVNCSV